VDEREVARAAEVLAAADAIVVAAGAGMGVDSGLPDFRGDDGFWNAYPPYRDLQVTFTDMASPAAFHRDPRLAWGFYGHRRALYRATLPHDGFGLVSRWLDDAPEGGFVVTSNVDGHFHAADYDPEAIWEVHGTLRLDQCLGQCGAEPFGAGPDIDVDETTMRAVGSLPSCPACGGLARPNVLMFGDGGFDPVLTDAQERRFAGFLHDIGGGSIVVLEVGAGTAVPTIRRIGQYLVHQHGAKVLRINPREADGAPGVLPIAAGAVEALEAIHEALVHAG
jgi:NAD-dependent SIR2 family protein deacetylase